MAVVVGQVRVRHLLEKKIVFPLERDPEQDHGVRVPKSVADLSILGPERPIEDDPPQCDGQLIVDPMSNNVPCAAPDVSPCIGCNDYCLDNGFPFGSTSETCEASVCECGCTYCRPN